MSYALTADGRDLASVLRLLADWGARRGGGEPLQHELCGTALETRWWCPTCSVAIDGPGRPRDPVALETGRAAGHAGVVACARSLTHLGVRWLVALWRHARQNAHVNKPIR